MTTTTTTTAPASVTTVTATTPTATMDTLDDIFGTHPSTEHNGKPSTKIAPPLLCGDLSDIPALRRRHVTNGYREGISESKGNYIQEGFDAGFPIGAQLGMRAGTVLGILEGLIRGFESHSASGVVKKKPQQQQQQRIDDAERKAEDDQRRLEKRERVLKLYRTAVKELAVEGVFAGLDGGKIKGEGGGGEVLDEEVKEKKDPREELMKKGNEVISAWEARVFVAGWEENMDALEAKDGGDGDGDNNSRPEMR